MAGAGISLGAKHPDDHKYHDVRWMVDELKNHLIKKRHSRYTGLRHGSICKWGCVDELNACGLTIDVTNLNDSNCFFCDVRKAFESLSLGKLAELFLWEFEEIKEAYKELVKILRIEEYKKLTPTIAHYYIAKLVGEGLIHEVITTNYDCNFEKAYDELSGGDYTDVIASLDDYRRDGARCDGDNRLKVFKVNGCAEKLGDGSDPKRCESILLTERQLQKWRNRQWAADIFRDRLRSRSLLFVGFGSDEPQIHHTLQAVLDEYTDELEDNNCLVLETPSAPVVAIFDPHPTFHQQQIVNTYAVHHKKPAIHGDNLIIRHRNPGANLSADDLWKYIYERVIRVKIIEALKSSLKSMNASFTAIVPYAQVLLHDLVTSFESSAHKDDGFSTAVPDWLAAFESVVSGSGENSKFYSHLVKCLSALKGVSENQYESVTENNALITELSFVLFMLHDELIPELKESSCNGLTLTFIGSDPVGNEGKTFYLNADPTNISPGDKVETPAGNNHLALVLGQAGAHIRPILKRVVNEDDAASTIKPKTIVILGWQHIFYQRQYDGNKDNVGCTLKEAIESPTNFFYENQPSIKRRPYLKEV